MKITKISELIKALEHSKEKLQLDDLSEVLSVYVENQGRENGVNISDPAVFSEDDFELIECLECKNEFLLNMDEAPLGFYCPYCSTAHEWEE